MKILFVSQEPRYERIVRELRKSNAVDYLFRGPGRIVGAGDYPVPSLFGVHLGYLILAYLTVAYLLLIGKYDICVTDYKSVYLPSIFLVLRKHTNLIRTNFVYDIRTIPVDHSDLIAEVVERRFQRHLRFADRFYQGISVITTEMEQYIREKYLKVTKPVGIWESGVEKERFLPLPKNVSLKKDLGFDDDFICFYHGSLALKRGVVELIRSFGIIRERESAIKLLLVGSDRDVDTLRKEIRNLHLEDTVKLHDWIDYDVVPQFISIADLCIVPLPDIDWWRVSSPFKLMEYIASGKNILLTDMAAHTNVVGKSENYFWVEQVTPESLAGKIEESYRRFKADSVSYYRMGMEERKRLVDAISWDCRAQSLMKYLSGVNSNN